MESVRLLVNQQLLVTLFLVAMLWLFFFRLRRQDFFRLWAWAWTSFALFLGAGSLALRVPSDWGLLKRVTVLATVEAGFSQITFLVLGARSLQKGEIVTSRCLRWSLGAALGAGALACAISFAHSAQPIIAYCWRDAPRTVALAVGLLFCAWTFLRKWRADATWELAVLSVFCFLYATNQTIYSFVRIHTLVAGAERAIHGAFGMTLLLSPDWLFLDSTYTFGIGLGLVTLLVKEHQRVERALVESDVRGRQFAEDYAVLQAEIQKRELAEQELRRTSLQLMRAEEEERARIGREMHDGMGAQLMLFMMEISELKRQCAKVASPLVPRMEKLETAIQEIGDYTRLVSHYLYSPSLEFLGLSSGLSDFCSEFGKQSGIQIEFAHVGVPKALPHVTAHCIFRVAQEVLRNVQKHSGSGEARVELAVESGSIKLSVSDKGRGFTPDLAALGPGRGLASMAGRVRSLGGHFSLQSSPGKGTTVMVTVPMGDFSADALPKAS